MKICPGCKEEIGSLAHFCVCCGYGFDLTGLTFEQMADAANLEEATKELFGDSCNFDFHQASAQEGCNYCAVCGVDLMALVLSPHIEQ